MTRPIIDKENASEMAWASPGTGWECEADNENGPGVFTCKENVLTGVEQYSYTRRITFDRDGKLYQFIATMGHDGDHEYGEPYEVEAYTETVTKYRKPDRGNQADRPVQRPPLPRGKRKP